MFLCSKFCSVTNTVTLKNSATKTQSLKLLLDSGADVSLIKQKQLTDPSRINTNDKIYLHGIGTDRILTIGSYVIELEFSDKLKVSQKFHVVQDNFPITQDGIMGRDMMKHLKIDIMYSQNLLKINYIDTKPTVINLASSGNVMTIPARTETYIQTFSPINGEVINHAEEILPGLFVGNSVSIASDNKMIIPIVNSNDHEVKIYDFSPQIETAHDYNIYALKDMYADTKLTDQRRKDIIDKIEMNLDPNLNIEERGSILDVCAGYTDLFHLEDEQLTCVPGVEHSITLFNDTAPINVRQYRLPQILKQEVNKQVEEMLREGKICHSTSPFNAPLLAVPKKPDEFGNKQWRVVVDFRKLNDATIGDTFPLPNIADIFDRLGHSRYFTTLDLASGYHQIRMNQQDQHKTAFSTDYGHYEFKRMPFGLKNSQSTFQRTMNHILTGFQGLKCFVYLDDVIIYGKNLNDHNQKLTEIFEIFRNYNLKLQPTKCHFLRKEINYLGHIISDQGIKPNPKTVESVVKFPVPKSKKEVQSFLGLANYYRKFIPFFSQLAEPINCLLRKNTVFDWSEDCDKAFITLKQNLTSSPILIYPDFNRTFILTTDASDYSLGAVLSQKRDGDDLPIAFASRSLNKAERNYATVEKEMLAVVWAIQNFRPYLYGRKFLVITDHKPLVGDIRNTPSRLLRWRLKLAEYDFTIEHKPGSKNTNADALSRIKHVNVLTRAQKRKNTVDNPDMTIGNESNTEQQESTMNSITDQIILDESDINHNNSTETVSSVTNQNFFNKNPQAIISPSQIQEILEEFHNSPCGGHSGIYRTFKRIRMLYYWPRMLKDISRFIKNCTLCKQNKIHRNTRIPMKLTTTSTQIFERLAFDIVGPLPTSQQGNKYLITYQDDLTKFSGAIPVPNQEAQTIAEQIVIQVFTKFGFPDSLLTDQGANFMSNLFTEMCKILKIKKLSTTAYHPMTNGALERSHRTLKEYLRCFVTQDHNNWDELIPFAIFVYNTTPHSATGFTTYELVFGKTPRIPHLAYKKNLNQFIHMMIT